VSIYAEDMLIYAEVNNEIKDKLFSETKTHFKAGHLKKYAIYQ